MTVEKQTNYGNISVSEEAVASLAGGMITECYGVVGWPADSCCAMAGQNF